MAGRDQVECDYSYEVQYTKYHSSFDSRHIRFTSCQQRLLVPAGDPGKNKPLLVGKSAAVLWPC
jgi:hypothetical protein